MHLEAFGREFLFEKRGPLIKCVWCTEAAECVYSVVDRRSRDELGRKAVNYPVTSPVRFFFRSSLFVLRPGSRPLSPQQPRSAPRWRPASRSGRVASRRRPRERHDLRGPTDSSRTPAPRRIALPPADARHHVDGRAVPEPRVDRCAVAPVVVACGTRLLRHRVHQHDLLRVIRQAPDRHDGRATGLRSHRVACPQRAARGRSQ